MSKRYLSLIAIALLALPVIAQDDFGGGGLSQGDLEALLGGGGGGRGGRGGRGGNNVQSILPDATVMYNQLKDLLKNKKVALAKEQEKPLQTLLADQVKNARTELETQFPALRTIGQPAQNQNNNQNNQNRGNQNNNNQNNQTVRIDAIVLEQNAALLGEIRKELTPEQVAILDKAEKDKKCVVLLDGHFSFLQNGNRGNGQGQNNRDWCTYGDSTVAQRVAPIRDLMKRERKPLTDAQDAKISSLVQARLPLLETALREGGVLNNNNRGGQQNAQNQQNQQQQQRQQMANNIVNQMFQAMNIPNQNNQGGRGGNNNFNFEQVLGVACAPEATQEQKDQAIQQLSQNFNNRGGGTPNLEQLCQNFGRGGNRGNQNNNLNFNTIRAEVEKKNEVILDKVVASLKPEQGSIIKKLKYEQIKAKGGAERIRGILEEEGTPLSADQIPKIQALFNESNQALRTQAQAMVLKAMETNPPPQQQPNTNQNRGNNNQQQQQSPQQQYMVNLANQMLPQVAKLRQQLDNATMNSVMRILTPAQVASYKINLTMPPL